MPPAARVTDMHTCPMVTGVVPHVGGPILPPGHPTTLIGFLPAARVGDMLTCVGPPDVIIKGSPTVIIGMMPAARMGDNTAHGGVIVMGHPTTMIGDAGSGGGGGGAAAPAPPAVAADAGEGAQQASRSGPSGEEVGPMLVQAARAGTALLRRRPPAPVAEEQTHTLKIRVVINDTDQAVKGLKLLITRPGQKKEEQVEEPHVTDPEGRIEIDDLEKGGSVKVRCELEGARLSHTYDYVGKGEKPLPVQSKDSEPRGLREASAEWRLANIKEHKVNTGETLDGIARANGMTWKELAEFNWGTSKPTEINEYLRDYVGCTKKTKDGNNYMFDSSDKPGIVYIPKEWKDSLATDIPKEHTIRVRELTRMLMHMYLDANRDGDVDKERSALNKKWEWEKDKKGAVILVNNDDDDDSGGPDHDDDKVNSDKDEADLAPLEFKRFGPPTPPPGWKAELRVSDKSKIRIFYPGSDGGKVIIGPKKGDTYDFKDDLSPREWKFGMEATQYAHKAYTDRSKKAHKAFDGTIRLTLKLTSPAPDSKTYEEWAEVRVAPWMMPNHLDKAEKVHVIKVPGYPLSDTFRAALKPLVNGATGSDPTEYDNWDIWMQDCMEIGYSALPKHAIHAVMRAPRGGALMAYPKTLLAKEFGYHEKGIVPSSPRKPSTFDSNGNLEVTPPLEFEDEKKKDYRWGRIYFGGHERPGETFDPEVKAFLECQVVQKPISVDTTWLVVGHVDEMMSFVPGGPKGFTMLLASPKRAYKILDDNLIPYGGTLKLLTKRELGGHSVETSILSFLVDGVPHHTAKGKGKELRKFNEGIQSKIDKTREQFLKALPLEESDVLDVPVLFMPSKKYPKLAGALTADMVNMLVINKHCIFPKPFGPVVKKKDLFEEELTTKLKALGLTPHAIDDWDLYHAAEGEVHCGTNTTREAKKAKWWEFKP